jgi:type IV pilus assembly protein PilX
MTPMRVPRRQQGAALITVIVLLLVMTLLGLVSVRATVLEERMSAGMLDRSIAFQAAEAALREGERQAVIATFPASGCISGLCGPPDPTALPVWESDSVWNTAPEAPTDFEGHVDPPKYIIELIATGVPGVGTGECSTSGDVSGPGCTVTGTQRRFRITARSQAETADDGRAVVLLQSILAAN